MNTSSKKRALSIRKISLLGFCLLSSLAACKDSGVNASSNANLPKDLNRDLEVSSAPLKVSSPSTSAPQQLTPVQNQQKVAQLSRQDWNRISAWQGTWKTSYGEMRLRESNPYVGSPEAVTKVDGTYDTDSGKIDAVIYDTGLTGYWIETSSAQKCDTQRQGSFYWGRIEFNKEIPNPDAFTGKWSYCNDNPTRKWSGKRIGSVGQPPSAVQIPRQVPQTSFQSLWQGSWRTSEGSMNLQFAADGQDDTILSGSYSQDGGRIEGYIQQNILNGYWAENGSAQRCSTPRLGTYHWGRIRFNLNDAGNAFTGKWSYCDAEPSSSWTGSRT